jgi:hypothetical protein
MAVIICPLRVHRYVATMVSGGLKATKPSNVVMFILNQRRRLLQSKKGINAKGEEIETSCLLSSATPQRPVRRAAGGPHGMG